MFRRTHHVADNLRTLKRRSCSKGRERPTLVGYALDTQKRNQGRSWLRSRVIARRHPICSLTIKIKRSVPPPSGVAVARPGR